MIVACLHKVGMKLIVKDASYPSFSNLFENILRQRNSPVCGAVLTCIACNAWASADEPFCEERFPLGKVLIKR